jgi:dephospho-CoA kinase
MTKYDVIIITGAPGTGKTTISNLLKSKLDSPLIDLGWLREYHLDRLWKKANKREAKMSFENLIFILKNYKKYGYKEVIVNDLLDEMVRHLPRLLKYEKYLILTLVVKDNSELKRRVLGERDSGFKNYKKAILWNDKIQKRKLLKNEIRIDNTHNNLDKTLKEILGILR